MISARTPSLAALSSFLLIVASGCVIDGFGLENRRCPCLSGWVCDEAADRCVEAVTADAGEVLPDADVSSDAYVPVDAPPPPPFCETISGAIFCDDFESGDLTRWGTVEPAAGGSITTSAEAAHSGSQGLRLSAGAGAMRITVPVITTDIDPLYFRAWVRQHTDTAGTLNIFELFAAEEGSVSAHMLLGPRQFLVRIASAGTEGISEDGRAPRWEPGAWRCVLGRVSREADEGEVQIFDSGPPHEQAKLTERDTDWGVPYNSFKITLEGSEAGSQIDLDDISWTRSSLPCP